jgi:hydrogenase maturation protein HypF
LTGICHIVQTEAQAACELEAAAVRADGARTYRFGWRHGDVDPAPLVRAVVADVADGVPVGRIALGFHAAVCDMVVQVCEHLRSETDLRRVALSGGVWLNQLLLQRSVEALEQRGFTALVHRDAPSGDGGLALGQAAIAACRLTSLSS